MPWDDRQADEARLIATLQPVEPQAMSFPVVIGAGSHPFPFRTRKLSLPPPMVLRAQVRGRVGRCREYSSKPASCNARGGLFHLAAIANRL